MDSFDERIPDDLRDIAERLSRSRAAFSPLELDELRGSLASRAGRALGRRSLRGFRMRSAAGLVAGALMLTSGAGVVIASQALGGGPHTFSDSLGSGNNNAANCQYHGRHEKTVIITTTGHGHGRIMVIITFDCRHFRFHINFPAQQFNYWFDAGAHQSAFSAANGDAPAGANTLFVGAGSATYSVPLNI